jgi:hypothetical protein
MGRGDGKRGWEEVEVSGGKDLREERVGGGRDEGGGGEGGRRGWEERVGGEGGRRGWEERVGGGRDEGGRRGGGEARRRGWEERVGGGRDEYLIAVSASLSRVATGQRPSAFLQSPFLNPSRFVKSVASHHL